MDSEQLVDFLRGSGLGEGLDDADLARLAESGTVRDVAAGETLLAEGRRGGGLVVVLEGQVEIFKSRGEDRIDLGLLGPGGVVGEVGVVLDQPATASVRTLGRCRVFELRSSVFRDLVGEVSASSLALSLSMARLLALRLQRTNEHALELYRRAEEGAMGLDDAELEAEVAELIELKNELLGRWNL